MVFNEYRKFLLFADILSTVFNNLFKKTRQFSIEESNEKGKILLTFDYIKAITKRIFKNIGLHY